MRRVGVFGGTFDPIHIGHLIVAECVREACGLDRVLFVPAGVPPHKEAAGITSARHRYMMTVLATLTHPHFEVSRVDIDREGPCYTVDTLAILRSALAPAELYFLMGSDSLADLPTWHEPERLLGENRLIVAGRPGWSIDEASAALGPLYERHRDRIEHVTVPGIDVSSRAIRARLAAGKSARYQLPDLVLHYIETHGLYRTG